jgi:Domain of unknown function (DUF4402)
MKKSFKLSAIIFAMTCVSSSIKAQTVTTTVGAKIVEAITLTETSPMHFGTMAIPTSAATVVLDLGSARTSTGSVALLAQAPIATAAGYNVTGTANSTYTIVLPSSTTITNGVPANNMTVNAFTCSYPLLVGTISAFSTDFFFLGATLNLANAQVSGTYSGTFDVTVAYN